MRPTILKRPAHVSGAALAAALAGVFLLSGGQAQASENGTSVYLLGSGGPGTAIMPPVKGLFFANTTYFLSGEARAGRLLPVSGAVVADLEATVVADFPALLWVPTTDFAGGTLALGLVTPMGHPDLTVSGVVIGPGGGVVSGARSDSAFVVGDPILTGMLGWTTGTTHIQASTMLNIPVGDYREGELANLAFNRWAFDTSLAVSWRDDESGWDVSAKTGVTFNGENDHTAYETGTEWHTEISVEKILSPGFSAGLQAYRFEQISDDSGAGASLGAFRGAATGVGATAAWNFNLANRPASLRLRALTEFDVENRMEQKSVFIDFSIPLVMQIPAG